MYLQDASCSNTCTSCATPTCVKFSSTRVTKSVLISVAYTERKRDDAAATASIVPVPQQASNNTGGDDKSGCRRCRTVKAKLSMAAATCESIAAEKVNGREAHSRCQLSEAFSLVPKGG